MYGIIPGYTYKFCVACCNLGSNTCGTFTVLFSAAICFSTPEKYVRLVMVPVYAWCFLFSSFLASCTWLACFFMMLYFLFSSLFSFLIYPVCSWHVVRKH